MRALGATNGAARSAVAWRLRAIGAWAVAVALGVSCSDSATAPRPRPRDPGSFVVASHAAAASEVAYVSLPPATIQNGVEARLRVGRAATTVIVPVVDGGFDPVALGAAVGDSIAIDVQASDTVLSFMLVVPRPSRPVVVRTSPPPHKRDVSLNANIVVVFSEPIDPATLTGGAMLLRKAGVAVPGLLDFTDAAHLTARFVPAAPLAPSTDYELAITQGIHDLDGLGLATDVIVPFTTAGQTTPPAGTAYVYLANADGSGAARLTVGDAPSWSPDGRQIAFARSGVIRVIGVDGSGEKALASGSSPAWSPDGRRIAFTSSDGISVMSVDGSGVRTLVRHHFRDDTYAPWDMGVGKPAWSPDGTRIAFEHLGDGDTQPPQVFVMSSEGSTPSLLSRNPGGFRYAESDPSWSPDGSKVLYWSYGFGIVATDANGGTPVQIHPPQFPAVQYGAKPVWSPDGATIAFISEPSVWTITATGSNPRLLIPSAYGEAWSPDGARIAFVSRRTE